MRSQNWLKFIFRYRNIDKKTSPRRQKIYNTVTLYYYDKENINKTETHTLDSKYYTLAL